MILKEPLQFVFSGYSIWLEPEQFQHDLDLAIKTTTTQLGLPLSIPSPHITAVYGISHLSEDSVRERFESIGDSLQDSWPIMIHEGFRNDIEISGVDSGEMDMAWIEITFKTSALHEKIVDMIYYTFYDDETQQQRKGPWVPHISLAYDSETSPIPMDILSQVIERYPTLQKDRKITGISLWRTEGKMESWTCLDRISWK